MCYWKTFFMANGDAIVFYNIRNFLNEYLESLKHSKKKYQRSKHLGSAF